MLQASDCEKREKKEGGGEESCEKKGGDVSSDLPCTPIKYSVWGTALKSLEI